MTSSLRAGVIAVVAIAIGIGLSGCGSDTKAEPSTSKQTSAESSATSSKAAPTTSAQAAGPNKTIVDYIKENAIVASPGAPRRRRLSDNRLAVAARVGGRRKPHTGVGLQRDRVH